MHVDDVKLLFHGDLRARETVAVDFGHQVLAVAAVQFDLVPHRLGVGHGLTVRTALRQRRGGQRLFPALKADQRRQALFARFGARGFVGQHLLQVFLVAFGRDVGTQRRTNAAHHHPRGEVVQLFDRSSAAARCRGTEHMLARGFASQRRTRDALAAQEIVAQLPFAGDNLGNHRARSGAQFDV